MRYIKKFESYGSSERDIIEKYWELNPVELKDIFLSLSETHGTHVDEIGFYISLNDENCNIFWYDGNVYKKGPWNHNLEDIVASAKRGYNKIYPILEIWLDRPENFEKSTFVSDLEYIFSEYELPYSLVITSDLVNSILIRLEYNGLTELYNNTINESVNTINPLVVVNDYWNMDPYEFRDIVTATLEGFDENDFELKFSIVYKSHKYHLVEFDAGKLVWCKNLTYDIQTYLDLFNDVPDDVEVCISLILPIDRDKDNVDYVKSICQEFDERLSLWSSDWRPKEIIDILRNNNYLTMIIFLPAAKSGYIKKVNPFFRKKK